MKNKDKHSVNRLTYAIDATGKVVGVDDVQSGNKCSCFCPACNEPLTAKNQGLRRMHHFAHQSGTECEHAYESMLHVLAKEKIRKAFLEKTEFIIEFEYKSFCSKKDSCIFFYKSKCCSIERRRYNLKSYYDSCEQEVPYSNINRRSDLKIFSSTNSGRKPIYLEFCVTHASDIAKLHSKNKIIEISIECEDDILQLAEHGIYESESKKWDRYYGFDDDNRKICFYGFNSEDYNNDKVSIEVMFERFILYKSGKTFSIYEECNCKKIKKSRASSIIELCIYAEDYFSICDKARYIWFQKYKIPNCILCRHYVNKYSGDGKICRLYKQLQIPRDDSFDTARAKTCNCFEIDQEEMKRVLDDDSSDKYICFD